MKDEHVCEECKERSVTLMYYRGVLVNRHCYSCNKVFLNRMNELGDIKRKEEANE